MKKKYVLRIGVLSAILAFMAVVLLTSTASAHTSVTAQRAVAATSQVPSRIPNVNIITRNGKAVFSPNVVHCQSLGRKRTAFTITNLTHKTQTVIFRGKVLITIPPGFIANIAVTGHGEGFDFLKSNPNAVLTFIAP